MILVAEMRKNPLSAVDRAEDIGGLDLAFRLAPLYPQGRW